MALLRRLIPSRWYLLTMLLYLITGVGASDWREEPNAEEDGHFLRKSTLQHDEHHYQDNEQYERELGFWKRRFPKTRHTPTQSIPEDEQNNSRNRSGNRSNSRSRGAPVRKFWVNQNQTPRRPVYPTGTSARNRGDSAPRLPIFGSSPSRSRPRRVDMIRANTPTPAPIEESPIATVPPRTPPPVIIENETDILGGNATTIPSSINGTNATISPTSSSTAVGTQTRPPGRDTSAPTGTGTAGSTSLDQTNAPTGEATPGATGGATPVATALDAPIAPLGTRENFNNIFANIDWVPLLRNNDDTSAISPQRKNYNTNIQNRNGGGDFFTTFTAEHNHATLSPTKSPTPSPTPAPTLSPTESCPTITQLVQIGIDIQLVFDDDEFVACSQEEDSFILYIMESILTAVFPTTIPTWNGSVIFGAFGFDDTQLIHQHQHQSLRQRHLQTTATEDSTSGTAHSCLDRTTVCPSDTTCRFGCGMAQAIHQGCDAIDYSSWSNLSADLTQALTMLEFPCLGAHNPPLVEVSILSIHQ